MIQSIRSRRVFLLSLILFGVFLGITLSNALHDFGNGDQMESDLDIVAIPDIVKHTEFSNLVITNPAPSAIQGQGLGLVQSSNLSVPPFERPQTEEFQLATGEPFAPYLVLVSQDDASLTVLVTALLDYDQVSFELDGYTGLLHEVVIPPHTELNLPMRLTVEGSGAHDLIFIAFVDPYLHSPDVNTRDSDLGNIIGRRTQIIVGDKEEPFKTLPLLAEGQDAPSEMASIPIRIGFAATPEEQTSHPSARQIVFTRVVSGESFPFQIWVTNFGDELPVEYGMVAFLNYHQIPLNQHQVATVQLGTGRQEAILNTDVMIPEFPVIHEFQVIYVFDPYKSILHEQVSVPFVFSTVRLSLDAR